ncbi:MAG: type IX secretion system sortase PorU [Bacteroidetes bacterium]|nr:type IX secretion system sortase PorU [Bacteroidota bacterium]
MQQYFIFFVVLRNISTKKSKQMLSTSKSNLIILVFLFSGYSLSYSQINKQTVNNNPQIQSLEVSAPTENTFFLDRTHRDIKRSNLPYFLEHTVFQNNEVPSFKLENIVTRELSSKETEGISEFKHLITADFELSSLLGKSRQENVVYSKIVPVRLNSSTNKYEFLVSYSSVWDNQTINSALSTDLLKKNKKVSAANSSVLASGKWYKIGVTQDGVYKINKTFLSDLGLDITNINPKDIRIYGNGGKLMPEKNSVFRYDDLQENAIAVVGENDGVFNNSDYILFYGQSTDSWKIQPGSKMPFDHQLHYFSDTSFYFITADLGAGKRITAQTSLSNSPNVTTNSQDYYGYHEQNLVNLVKSGREFYGEKFDINTVYSFSFNVPDAVVGDSVYVYAGALSRSDQVSSYGVNFNNGSFTFTCAATNTGSYLADVGYFGDGSKGGILSSPYLSVSVSKLTTQASGWLDKIEFNCRRNLVFNQSQFTFRDRRTVIGSNTFAKYVLTNNNSTAPTIWDVTNPLDVKQQQYNTNVTLLDFTSTSDSLKQFCVFTDNQAYTPKAYGSIPNQNLHAIQQADLVIVTHPSFLAEAQRIATIHQTYDTLTYAIATTQEVYNEFSSGTPDIGGIRDFVKMLYKRPSDPNQATQYLLLLGDGSYKNKDISVSGNTAMIPSFETSNSSSYISSFITDDYFAMMDDNEGDLLPSGPDLVDIGVGRFPVKDKAEAVAVTNKIEHYYKKNYGFDVNAIESSCTTAENDYPQGDWRNWVCFIADDEDNNEHISQANALANKIYNGNKYYNVDKIFLDSYVQYSTPGGDRYPDAVNDLNRRMEKGALIINYTGHGGELGLAEERIVEVSQILAWRNKNNMPLMVTATCEFSRFDDPDRTSAGEYCLLNENGGAVGLMTTVRLAFSGLNYILNDAFYNYALTPMSNGKMPHIGDIYRLTKRQIGTNEQYRNFVILGDPALKLSYPEQRVFTSAINSQTVTPTSSDTLKALALISVSGYVGDKNGNKLTGFNGVVYPTVFDKETTVNTLANDPGSNVMSFLMQKNIIYRGKSAVVNGDFTFSFLVPKDISYNFGKGKISYYAHNGVNDANGYYDKVIIGGSNPNATVDNQGPTVNLYMNDSKFVSGGLTNENPKVYAEIADVSGINTIGTGIGHDAVAILDENSSKPIILNDYYVSDLNTYQSGKIRYPLNELSEGNHRLSLKVWDVQNNSSSAYTDFVVSKQADLALTHILNYPNPFTTKTKFFIEHNQCCTNLKVLIQIYTITGKVVKSINQTINNEGFRFDGIEWDGKDEFGDKLARGVYIYKVTVTDGAKKKADKIEKLVILN